MTRFFVFIPRHMPHARARVAVFDERVNHFLHADENAQFLCIRKICQPFAPLLFRLNRFPEFSL